MDILINLAVQAGRQGGKKFKPKALRELLSIQDKSMEIQRQLINKAFENSRGDLEQVDDDCIISAKID
jgi:hypothetical protein